MKTRTHFLTGIRTLIALLLVASAVPAVAEEDTTQNFWYGGVQRNYQYYVPPGAGPTPPALMVLHGHGGNYNSFWADQRLHRLADEEGVVLIYPEGQYPYLGLANSWNAGGICCGLATATNVNDNGFLRKVIKDMANRHGLDRSRIYVTGHSNGAIMSQYLALRSDDLVAGIAPISFALQDNATWRLPEHWHPPRPVPVQSYHSYPDNLVWYEGGLFFGVTTPLWLNGAERGIEKWAEINGCGALTRVVRGYPGLWVEDRQDPQRQNANYFTYADCGYDVPNNLVSLYQGDHGSVLDTSVTGLKMQEDVWARMSVLRKPGNQGSELWEGVDLVVKNGEKLESENDEWAFKYDNGQLMIVNDAGARTWTQPVTDASRLVTNSGALQAIKDGYWENYTVRHCVWFVCWNETRSRFVEPRVVWQSNLPVTYGADWKLILSDQGTLTLTNSIGQVTWRSH